jgi:protein-L-isoaspartate(D-aspartate) O-methyltransferase
MTRDPNIDVEAARRAMLEKDVAGRGVTDARVLAAMERVRRELFVPEALRGEAYVDGPLPIGHGQTISQPFMVAKMIEEARFPERARVLDIGTGSGYAAAVAAEMGAEVWSIERIEELAEGARTNLRSAGYGDDRVHLAIGDGYAGWPEAAPFDAILVAAASEQIPDALMNQLRIGGAMIVPIRDGGGELLVRCTRKSAVRFEREDLFPVRFVPLVKG